MQKSDETLKKNFSRYDRAEDGEAKDGKVTVDEFVRALRRNKANITEDEITHLIKTYDPDDNGEITLDEYLKARRGELPEKPQQ